jgi:hypothetical protein
LPHWQSDAATQKPLLGMFENGMQQPLAQSVPVAHCSRHPAYSGADELTQTSPEQHIGFAESHEVPTAVQPVPPAPAEEPPAADAPPGLEPPLVPELPPGLGPPPVVPPVPLTVPPELEPPPGGKPAIDGPEPPVAGVAPPDAPPPDPVAAPLLGAPETPAPPPLDPVTAPALDAPEIPGPPPLDPVSLVSSELHANTKPNHAIVKKCRLSKMAAIG